MKGERKSTTHVFELAVVVELGLAGNPVEAVLAEGPVHRHRSSVPSIFIVEKQ